MLVFRLQLSRQLLTTICGVPGNSKLCTRSTRCPAHTDVQRREVRLKWLGGKQDEDIEVDSDGEATALRESLSQLSNASRFSIYTHLLLEFLISCSVQQSQLYLPAPTRGMGVVLAGEGGRIRQSGLRKEDLAVRMEAVEVLRLPWIIKRIESSPSYLSQI